MHYWKLFFPFICPPVSPLTLGKSNLNSASQFSFIKTIHLIKGNLKIDKIFHNCDWAKITYGKKRPCKYTVYKDAGIMWLNSWPAQWRRRHFLSRPRYQSRWPGPHCYPGQGPAYLKCDVYIGKWFNMPNNLNCVLFNNWWCLNSQLSRMSNSWTCDI